MQKRKKPISAGCVVNQKKNHDCPYKPISKDELAKARGVLSDDWKRKLDDHISAANPETVKRNSEKSKRPHPCSKCKLPRKGHTCKFVWISLEMHAQVRSLLPLDRQSTFNLGTDVIAADTGEIPNDEAWGQAQRAPTESQSSLDASPPLVPETRAGGEDATDDDEEEDTPVSCTSPHLYNHICVCGLFLKLTVPFIGCLGRTLSKEIPYQLVQGTWNLAIFYFSKKQAHQYNDTTTSTIN